MRMRKGMGAMTTDNRTSEPSEEQVEAAARAIADNLFSRWTLTSRVSASKDRGSLIHVAARAALVAAAGAAPHAESEYAYCPIHGDLLAANRSYRCGNAPTGHEYAAPVQPSSTVDEAALAEAEARIAEAEKLHYRDTPSVGGDWCPEDHHKWPCQTAVALGLSEGSET